MSYSRYYTWHTIRLYYNILIEKINAVVLKYTTQMRYKLIYVSNKPYSVQQGWFMEVFHFCHIMLYVIYKLVIVIYKKKN